MQKYNLDINLNGQNFKKLAETILFISSQKISFG